MRGLDAALERGMPFDITNDSTNRTLLPTQLWCGQIQPMLPRARTRLTEYRAGRQLATCCRLKYGMSDPLWTYDGDRSLTLNWDSPTEKREIRGAEEISDAGEHFP